MELVVLFWLDRNAHGGGISVYVRKDISSKLLKGTDFDWNLELVFVETNLIGSSWKESSFIFIKALKFHFVSFYFNVGPTEKAMEEFILVYNLKKIVKGPTCFKNPNKPSCIDFIVFRQHNSCKRW